MNKFFTKFEGPVLKYLLAAVLLAVPLYPKFPLLFVPGIHVAVRLEDFLIAIVLAIWLFTKITRRDASFIKNPTSVCLLIFLALGLVSTVSAILVTHSVIPHIGLLHLLRRVEYVSLFFLALTIPKNRKDIYFFLGVFFVTTFFIFLYGLGQKYLGFPVISTQNEEFSKGLALRLTPGARLNSTFAGHYDLAAFMVITIPLYLTLLVAKVSRDLKFIGAAGFIISFYLLILSSSRISFPAYLVAASFLLLSLKKFKLYIPLLLGSLFFMTTSTELAARYLRTADIYLAPLAKLISVKRNPLTEPPFELAPQPTPTLVPFGGGSIGNSSDITPIPTPTRRPKLKRTATPAVSPVPEPVEDRSTAIRFNVEWPRARRAFLKNPLLGTGYSSITLATDNDYLRSLGEIGLLGTFAFILVFVSLGRQVFKIFKFPASNLKRILVTGFTASIIGFLVNASFIDVFEASKSAIPFWAISGFLAALVKMEIDNT